MHSLDTKVRGAIVHAVLDSDLFGDSCELAYLESENGVRRHLATSPLKSDPNLHVVFSLPTDGKNIYISVSDGDISLIHQIFATLEDMEEEGEVRLGNVQLFKDDYLNSIDIHGVLMLPVAISNILGFLPEKINVGSVIYKFLLVVFLSEDEHMIWKKNGHDALMDHFTATGKDIVSFGSVRE